MKMKKKVLLGISWKKQPKEKTKRRVMKMTVRMNGKEGKLRLLERVGCLIQGMQNGACLIRGPKLGDMLVISYVSNHPI